MAVLPSSREDMINWFAARIAQWGANAAQIGISPAQIAALATLLSEADSALSIAEGARITSKNATVDFHNAADALRELGGDFITLIKANAEATNNPDIYTLASIPPPAAPSPLGPPATPTNLTTTLTSAGSIKLRWRGSRRGGTSFKIWRSTTLPGMGATQWQLINSVEENKFEDGTVPLGLESVTYRVVATRSGGSSEPSDVSTIFFGSAGGQASTNATGGTNLTIAA